MKHLWPMKTSSPHFFQKEVDQLKITQKRANTMICPLGTLPYSENKKQKRKHTRTANQMNNNKKKPETYA